MNDLLHLIHRGLDTIVGNYGSEESGYFIITLAEDILMVEPHSFLIVELGSAL